MTPEDYIRKADHALTSAGMLYDGAEADDCVSRAYAAMRFAASAAPASRNMRVPKGHGSLISLFSDTFVRDGPLAPGLGRAINGAEKARISADYTEEFAELETARLVLDRARHFVAAIKEMLQADS